MCPVQIKPWSTVITPGWFMAAKGPFLEFFGFFGGLWCPLKAFLYPWKSPNTLFQMWPGQIKPWSSLINQFGSSRVIYGTKSSFLPFLAIFCHVYLHLPQNWGSDGHFEELNKSNLWLVQNLWHKTQIFPFLFLLRFGTKTDICLFCVFCVLVFFVITFVPIKI